MYGDLNGYKLRFLWLFQMQTFISSLFDYETKIRRMLCVIENPRSESI